MMINDHDDVSEPSSPNETYDDSDLLGHDDVTAQLVAAGMIKMMKNLLGIN